MYFRSADLTRLAPGLVALFIFGVISGPARAADLRSNGAYEQPTPVSSGWEFRITPYAWAPSVNGDVTVRGHTVDIDMSFWDLFNSGNSKVELESLLALMGYVEARKGPWGIYGDVVWGNFDFSGGAVKQRNPIADLNVSARAKAGLGYEITMAEGGLTYEVANWGGPTLIDSSRSAWRRSVLESRTRSFSRGRQLRRSRQSRIRKVGFARCSAIRHARMGRPVRRIARLRHELAPGKELQFLGDIGGFGVGSDLTWQLFAGYSFDFSLWQSTLLHGLVGYRALAVDYTQDSGTNKNNLDLILHGPVVGLSFRW